MLTSLITVEEYHRRIVAGLLTEDDHVELLEGRIVHRLPRGPAHDATLELSHEHLRNALAAEWRIRQGSAITLADSEPEPDLAVARGPARRYLSHHPGPADLAMLVEVSLASLDRDRNDKGRIYARARITCYWIVNLVDRQVEVYSDPTGPDAAPRFRQQQDYRPGDAVPLVIDGAEVGRVAVNDLLP